MIVHLSKGKIIIEKKNTEIIQYPFILANRNPNILFIQILDLDKRAILNSLVNILPNINTAENIRQKAIKVDDHGSMLMFFKIKLEKYTVLLVAIKIDKTNVTSLPNSSTRPLLYPITPLKSM